MVFVTVPSYDKGREIAKFLLEKKLCACVNVISKVSSFYWWEGKIEEDEEALLIIKTREELFEKLKEAVLDVHPYDVPEIISIPIQKGYKKYLDWIEKETK